MQRETASQVEHLQRLVRSFEEAQRIAHLGSWDWDIASGDLWWSDEVYRIFGFGPGAFLPTYAAFLDSVHTDDRAAVEAAVAATVASPDAEYSIQHRIVRPDGSLRTVHEIGQVEREGGRAVRMLGTVLDVTERVEVEQSLRESKTATERARELESAAVRRLQELDRQKRSFLTGVSHELRTPLTVMRGVGETLRRLPADDDATRLELLDRLERNTGRLSDLIEDLLLVATQALPEPSERKETDLGELVATVAIVSSSARTGTIDMDVPPVRASVHVELVRRAVHALIDNALRYSSEASPVRVQVVPLPDGEAEIRVTDGGPGISSERRAAVLGAFERGEELVPHAPGVGIGLTIVRHCADAHRGEVVIEDHPGGGTVVRLLLRPEA